MHVSPVHGEDTPILPHSGPCNPCLDSRQSTRAKTPRGEEACHLRGKIKDAGAKWEVMKLAKDEQKGNPETGFVWSLRRLNVGP